jgi:CRISPR-associated endonuclease Cas3-HD
MTEIYSHPPEGGDDGKLLLKHLRDTASKAEKLVADDAETPSGEPLDGLVRRTALMHDIAKSTSFFQDYILSDGGSPDRRKHHAPLGSFVADYVLEKTEYSETERLAGFLAVSKHHGQLPDAGEYVMKKIGGGGGSETKREEMVEQVENISENEGSVGVVSEIIADATDGRGSWDEFAEEFLEGERFNQVKQMVVSEHGFDTTQKTLDSHLYPTALQIWSALVFADKTDAAGIKKKKYDAEYLEIDTLESHIQGLSPGGGERERELNDKREKARKEVLGNVEEFLETASGVGTITLPTGLGKTYTGLSAAMKARDLKDGDGRIVYALPFTSIIDQVVDDVIDVFDADITGKKLTVHHHLSETRTETEDDTDERADEEYTLGESWRSGTVVTTFVQLFESLAGPRNTQSMKLPSLYDSVVILDEPQALPHRWWGLARRLVRMLTEDYDATVIAMTATQPRIFEAGGTKPFRLIRNADDYFVDAERVEYVLDDSADEFLESEKEVEPVGYEEAATEIVESDATSTLAICNTIDSAEQLSDEVEHAAETVSLNKEHGEILDEAETVEKTVSEVSRKVNERGKEATAAAHLTTRLRPKDRLEIIEAAKGLTEKDVPLVVVSTQLIEAGVDISFERVYRDFAPMDSIVQAAGRCNRSFESDRGEVVVWWLAPPGGKEHTPSKAVYSKWHESGSLLPVVGDAINEVREGNERRLSGSKVARDAVESYYEGLHSKGVSNESLVKMFNDAEAEKLGEESLIENKRSVDVIVCRTGLEEEKIDEVMQAFDDEEYSKARAILNETKEIRVSVPLYTSEIEEAVASLQKVDEDYPDLRFLKAADNSKSKFDTTRGLVIEDASVEDRIL